MTAGNYVSVESMKNELNIDDTEDDEVLKLYANKGNRYVDDLLFIHAATLPLIGDQKTSADNVALAHALVHWYRKQRDFDTLKEMRMERDEEAKRLIEKLKAQPSTNTQSKTVAVSSSYRSSELQNRITS